jgi:hypothetical protein
VDEPRRRRQLTPLEAELRPRELPREPRPPGLLRRILRRRERRPPTTLAGAIGRAVVRLGVVVAVATAAALLVDHYLHRATSLGFYIAGAFVLAASVLMSTSAPGQPYYFRQAGREGRVSLSLSYAFAGFVIIGIAIAIDTFSS